MIYFDNIIFSLQKAGGISVVWQNLIENLYELYADVNFIEYQDSAQNLFRRHINIRSEKIIYHKLNKFISPVIHPHINYDRPFIFHSSYFRTCKNKNAINVTTVHDFIYEQGRPTIKQKLRILLNYRAIRESDVIVCISENTKRDLFKYLPDIPHEKVYVIYNGVSTEYKPLGCHPYPELSDYVLFVGGRHGYKNFRFAIEALKDTKYKLLICGSSLTNDEIDLLEEYLKDRYKVVEYPSNDELNKIYNSVYCLLYPSSYEGFGLPVIEAQRAGCPVIALNKSSIPEIVGSDNLLMEELSVECAHEMLNKLADESTRIRIVECGIETASKFSWEKMSKEYLSLYKRLLNN